MLHIVAGCRAAAPNHSRTRCCLARANLIRVVVLNSLPDNAICTAIYGMYELNINLGSDFTSGQTYNVRVNEHEVTFTAQ